MIFDEQTVIVLGPDGAELDIGVWSDELDDLARRHHGYAVVINSEPALIYADYRPVNGWTYDPGREVWWARSGPHTWTEVPGAHDDPPGFRPGCETVRAAETIARLARHM